MRHRAEIIEIDVRSTLDGILICWHDATTPDDVPISQQQLDTVQQKIDPWLWDDFVIALATNDPEHQIAVHLDLKATGYELQAVDALIELGQPFFVTTLEQTSIALLRAERPNEDAFLTIGRAREGRSAFSYFVLRCSELFPMHNVRKTNATGIAIHHQLLRRHIQWWARRRHLRVVVWTVNSSTGISSSFRSDIIDAVTTNFPLKALDLRQRFLMKG